MSRRKKDPYRWYKFSLWLIGTIAVAYFAHVYEWSSSPQTEKAIAEARDQFGNLNPEYSWVRVSIYAAFGSFIVYVVIRNVFSFITKMMNKEQTPT